jgi:hypothetical protein
VALSCNLAGKIKEAADKATQPMTVNSTDGRVQMVVPGTWSRDKKLNDVAILQAANPISEMYVIVISESKEDFDDTITLDGYTSLSHDGLAKNVSEAESKPPISIQVSGHSAREFQLSGTVDKIKVVYLCTVVETPTHFYQILTWSLRSRFKNNEATLRSVTQSFKEVKVGPPPKPKE